VEILRSPLLDAFPHGFTTRSGGASAAPFDSLNLGGGVGDDPAAVAENWRRLAAAAGVAFARVRQVHGDRVLLAERPLDPAEEADAVATCVPGVAACIAVADCVPVLVADRGGGSVAAVHAGWRGTLARVVSRAVETLVELGARREDLVAAVGPSIGPCCYEVAPDLLARFRDAFGAEVATAAGHLDLWRANVRALEDAGIAAARVDVLGRCTACEPRLFYSHRRDRGRTGRQVGFVAPRAPRPTRAP
jgi:purine-nucleoside/S-methyl-5'-thioadenosine phosphorylase / adenosine deaminase